MAFDAIPYHSQLVFAVFEGLGFGFMLSQYETPAEWTY